MDTFDISVLIVNLSTHIGRLRVYVDLTQINERRFEGAKRESSLPYLPDFRRGSLPLLRHPASLAPVIAAATAAVVVVQLVVVATRRRQAVVVVVHATCHRDHDHDHGRPSCHADIRRYRRHSRSIRLGLGLGSHAPRVRSSVPLPVERGDFGGDDGGGGGGGFGGRV